MRALLLVGSMWALSLLSACSGNGDAPEDRPSQAAATATTQATTSPSPTTTATATPTPTATARPTATVTAAASPTATATPTLPAPTATPTATLTLAPTSTPAPQRASASSQPGGPIGGSLRDQGATALGAVDNRSLAVPARNTLYSCQASQMGNALDRPWVDSASVVHFADKPVVPGSVSWVREFSVSLSADQHHVLSNGLPAHVTGSYPIPTTSEAYSYDRNPNGMRAQSLDLMLPAEPVLAAQPGCLRGGPIAITFSGAVIFNALDADNRDAVANEIFDLCEGHPQMTGQYHYHHGSPCFDTGDSGAHSPLVGFALDGFGLYGPRGDGGVLLTNADLGVCHGHIGPALNDSGVTVEVFHYHLNEQFPYSLGCYRGSVDPSLLGPPPPRR